ncbi:hypothetical protein HY968_04405 [Candidatus Kaiserbacteria bacterium]|nr:hypothetical protein [Candidatus Kaiserbacteria bacterium]
MDEGVRIIHDFPDESDNDNPTEGEIGDAVTISDKAPRNARDREHFAGKEDNDSQAPQVGDRVEMLDETDRILVRRYLGTDEITVAEVDLTKNLAHVVARSDYSPGMKLQHRPLSMGYQKPSYGLFLNRLRVLLRP